MARRRGNCYGGKEMPRHWIIGSCYLLIAAPIIYRTGVATPNWIPWLLLAAGILTLQYTPA